MSEIFPLEKEFEANWTCSSFQSWITLYIILIIDQTFTLCSQIDSFYHLCILIE